MPFCPKCKNEYYEGVKVCSECNIPLVDSLDELNDNIEEVKEDSSDAYPEDISLDDSEIQTVDDYYEPVKQYVTFDDRARDCISSAYTMIPIGLAGIAFILLCVFGVFTVLDGQLMIKIVMGALFLFFVIFGFMSIIKANKYKRMAVTEKEIYINILNFLKSSYTKESVDSNFNFDNELTYDEKYYDRYNFLMNELKNVFPNESESFLDYCLCKEFFDECFND